MATASLEQLFARFRRAHDLAALAEVFDRTAPELLEVARHLARGRGEAEDLVQATFLVVLESAQRFEEGRAFVPWLFGILAHQARRARAERRAVGEPAAELVDPGALDPASLAAETEFRSALEQALLRVPARYRDVLRRHLDSGEAPEEIARRLGRAPGTVRVQLHRGFRRLRRLLPAGLALGAAGILAPRGLAAVRANVLRAAGARLPSAGLVAGALAPRAIALAGLAVLVAVPAWWLGRDEHARPEAALAVADTETSADSGRTELTDADELGRRPRADPPETEAALVEPYGALALELAWWDGSSAAEVGLSVYASAERQSGQAYEDRTTDARGQARVERIRAGPVFVQVGRLGREGFEVEVHGGEERVERFVLPRLVDVVGRVFGASGSPVAGAQLWVQEASYYSARPVERSLADGSFRLRSVPEGFGILATAPGLGSSAVVAWEELQPVDEHTRRTELGLCGESASLRGTVHDAVGNPLAGARVVVRGYNSSPVGHAARALPFLRGASDEAGAFLFEGLHPGWAEVLVAAAGFAARQERVTLDEGGVARLAVELDAGFTVRGSIAFEDGSPAVRTGLHVEQHDFADQDLYSLYTRPDEEGNYVLTCVPAGLALLVASEHERKLRAQTSLKGGVGEELTWNVVFGSGAAILGQALDESGRALVGWSVRAVPERGAVATESARVVTDARGQFALADLADAAYAVHLYAPEDEHLSMPRAAAEGVFPGGPGIELVLRGERLPTAFLLGRVLDPDGAAVRPRQMWARRDDQLHSVGNPTWSEGERFRIGPMLAGAYELSLTLEPGLPSFRRALVLAEGEELDLGDLRVPPTGQARLTVRGHDGGPIPQPSSLCLTEGRYFSPLTSTDGLVFESGPMWPGSYTLRAMSGSAAPERAVPVEIRPGETTEVEARLAAARTVVFDFQVPEGERLPRRLRLEVRDGAGELAFVRDSCQPQSVAGHELLMVVAALPLGAFAYVAQGNDGWSASGPLPIEAGPEAQVRRTIVLAREH